MLLLYVHYIINVLLKGEYPDLFKITEVIPIFKKGNPELATNYRPISLNHQFNKIFENVTYSRMYDYLEKYSLIDERPFGFRSNHSTIQGGRKVPGHSIFNILMLLNMIVLIF